MQAANSIRSSIPRAFQGVEGVVKRIHGNKQVVVELEGLGGVTIHFVPKNFMMRSEP